MQQLQKHAKFIVDDTCYRPLFSAQDISIQQVEMNGKKEWVALVKLDSSSPDGYLQSEVSQCMSLDYMPMSIVTVRVMRPEVRDCHDFECEQRFVPMRHHHTKYPISYRLDITGATFDLTAEHGSHVKRRRLLWNRNNRC